MLWRILKISALSLVLVACGRGLAAGQSAQAGEIALSFDDAPTSDGPTFIGAERTHRIIAALAQEQVKGAIFFCTTKRLDTAQGRQRLERYAAAGHLIGNHTATHPNLQTTSPKVFIEDIQKADTILKTFPGFVSMFRYPHSQEGNSREDQQEVRGAIARLHYGLGYFTVDSADWYAEMFYANALQQGKQVDLEKLRAAYLEAMGKALDFSGGLARAVLHRSPKHVLILHETDINALFLGDLIRFIKSRGFTIIPAKDAYEDPIAEQIPDNTHTQSRLASIALEQGYPGPIDNPWANPTKLDELFAGALR